MSKVKVITTDATAIVAVPQPAAGKVASISPNLQYKIKSQGLVFTNKNATIAFIMYGDGLVLTTGVKGAVQIPFDCIINAWHLASIDNLVGDIVVDVWKTNYAGLPATVTNTITGTEKPTIVNDIKAQDENLTTWTTQVHAGDWLFFNIDSVTNLQFVSLNLKIIK